MALSGCGGEAAQSSAGSAPSQGNLPDNSMPAQGTAAQTDSPVGKEAQEDAAKEIKTLSFEPVEGWTFLDSASNDTFKSYNLLEPYVGSANFWIMFVGSGTFSGQEEDARAAIDTQGFSDYELISVEKLDYEMPTVRCIMNTTLNGMKFTLGHYFIDAQGDKDIYFQLSTAPENFEKAQPLWEEALKTLAVE
jgi:hypothetical protein